MAVYLIIGASRGLGKACLDGLVDKDDFVFAVSRNRPDFLLEKNSQWIGADLSTLLAVNDIKQIIDCHPIDVIIYNAGIWEDKVYEETKDEDISSIFNVNLINAVLLMKHLLPNVRKAQLKKIIFIGSTAGLENEGTMSVAYTASKFGLRGLTHSLREYVRQDAIAVTCLSPGSLATDLSFQHGEQVALDKYKGNKIPMTDIVSLLKCIISLSFASCVKEISLPCIFDKDV